MKITSLLFPSLLFFSPLTAQEEIQDERLGFDPLGANNPAPDLPKQVLVQIEFIELEHTKMSELLYGKGILKTGNTLRQEVQELIKNGEAKVAESSIIVARPGEEARVESAKHLIYPTEYDPPEVPDIKLSGNAKAPDIEATGPTPTAFEERPVGFTFIIEPNLGYAAGDRSISLDMNPEWTSYEGTIDWSTWADKRGTANVSMAQFYSLRMETAMTLLDGRYFLAGSLTPKNEKGFTNPDKKYMIFVRAIIKTLGQ